MDHDCFNIIVRKLASDDIQFMKKNKGAISKHYLDMRFWVSFYNYIYSTLLLMYFNTSLLYSV